MLKPLALSLALVASTACTVSHKSDNTDGPAPNATGADLSDLQSQSPTGAANLVAAFGFQPTTTLGAFVAFYSGNRYFSGAIRQTSPSTYEIMGNVGYYSESDNQIHTQGKRTTCQALATENKGQSTVTGTVAGSSLLVTKGATTVDLTRINVSTTPPPAGLAIQWGCFSEADGTFTSEAWSDSP